MIVNIRGTSGSGKSTLVKALMASFASCIEIKYEHTLGVGEVGAVAGKVAGYLCGEPGRAPVTIVGPYHTQCGGCDQVKTQDLVCGLVREFSGRMDAIEPRGHVVFEGLLITGNYQRYRDLARELGDDRYVTAFLDTDFDVCCARIDARRAEKGKGPLVDHSNTRAKWDAARTVARKLREDGAWVETLPGHDTAEALQFLQLLMKAGTRQMWEHGP